MTSTLTNKFILVVFGNSTNH